MTENYDVDSDVIIPATPPKKTTSRRALQFSTVKNVIGEGKGKQELDKIEKEIKDMEKEIDEMEKEEKDKIEEDEGEQSKSLLALHLAEVKKDMWNKVVADKNNMKHPPDDKNKTSKELLDDIFGPDIDVKAIEEKWNKKVRKLKNTSK